MDETPLERPIAPAFDPEIDTLSRPHLRILFWSTWPCGYRSFNHIPGEAVAIAWLVDIGLIESFPRSPWRPGAPYSTCYRATAAGRALIFRMRLEL